MLTVKCAKPDPQSIECKNGRLNQRNRQRSSAQNVTTEFDSGKTSESLGTLCFGSYDDSIQLIDVGRNLLNVLLGMSL
jgi:hypothetical protein